jgi:hypothetical protein
VKEVSNLAKFVHHLDLFNVIHSYEEVTMVDPLDVFKSIEHAMYKLKTDKITNFTPIELPSLVNAVREIVSKDELFEYNSFKRID